MSVSKYCSSCRPVPAAGAAQGLLITDPVSNLEFLLSICLRLSNLSLFPLPSTLSRVLPSADGSNIIQTCRYTCRQTTESSHSEQQCLHFLLPSTPLALEIWHDIHSNRCKSRPIGCKAQIQPVLHKSSLVGVPHFLKICGYHPGTVFPQWCACTGRRDRPAGLAGSHPDNLGYTLWTKLSGT